MCLARSTSYAMHTARYPEPFSDIKRTCLRTNPSSLYMYQSFVKKKNFVATQVNPGYPSNAKQARSPDPVHRRCSFERDTAPRDAAEHNGDDEKSKYRAAGVEYFLFIEKQPKTTLGRACFCRGFPPSCCHRTPARRQTGPTPIHHTGVKHF